MGSPASLGRTGAAGSAELTPVACAPGACTPPGWVVGAAGSAEPPPSPCTPAGASRTWQTPATDVQAPVSLRSSREEAASPGAEAGSGSGVPVPLTGGTRGRFRASTGRLGDTVAAPTGGVEASPDAFVEPAGPGGALPLAPRAKYESIFRWALADSTRAAMALLGRAGGADSCARDWPAPISPRGVLAGATTTRAVPI